MKKASPKIVFIGAGNLATHLSQALQKAGFEIVQVYSRTEESSKTLAEKLNTNYTSDIKALLKTADIYFVALKDSAVNEVLSQTDLDNKLLVHTSGSLLLSALNHYSKNYGVLYPLQTFSKSIYVEFREIPVFIEASSPGIENELIQIAKTISGKVSCLNSEKRKSLHIAAVFACNFVNYFYTLAAGYLGKNKISFDVLHPLIKETAKKATEMPPVDAQTGPAVRFDENVINDHLESLKNYPELKELYNSISRRIFELHQSKG
ncbi:Rossmann-like and DUF2520 domain-containing protein [Maribellus mangrovi]|uniref:Rossmann-like and DUF2520 domain-containing protein n=1 Tax=Maribellus mangrovi TaxID=3133146 RepID=UPI0030EF74D6